MITREEIESKASEFAIHAAHVERDYVFGWLLAGIYGSSKLRDVLILKGGNCFRKGYFSTTRFSADLDFSTEAAFDPSMFAEELNSVCDFVQAASGVEFVKDRTRVAEKLVIDRERKVYQARLYFKDFYGNPDSITISVRLDVIQFDKIYLPVQSRFLVHPYSDFDKCRVEIRCMKLEELLANKLKCLLQRRYANDLYDYVHSVFLNKEIDVDRGEIVRVFLKKTIFEPTPGVVRGLLVGLPLATLKAAWDKYTTPACPRSVRMDFDGVVQNFVVSVTELFGSLYVGSGEQLFFPAELRNTIHDAGSSMTLLKLRYHGFDRLVEPYSLVFKHRKDGYAREYFYAYDQTGGSSAVPGIRTFVHTDIESLEPTADKFEPRHEVELSKAGEPGEKTHFEGGSRSRGVVGRHSAGSRSRSTNGTVYVVECSYCQKRFNRSSYSTTLNEHKDRFGNRCYGRYGQVIEQRHSGW